MKVFIVGNDGFTCKIFGWIGVVIKNMYFCYWLNGID